MPAQSSASDTAAARVAAIPELVQNIFTQFVELDPANLNYTNSRTAAPSFANEYIKQGSALTLLSCRLVCHSWNTIACDVLFADADIGISLVLLEGQVSRAVLSVVGEIANEQECSHRLRQTMHALCNVNSEGRGLGHAVRGLSLDLTNLPCFTRLYGDDGAGSADWGSWDDILPLPRYVSAHSRRRRGGTWPVSNRDGYVRNVVELLRKVLGALRCLDRLTICLPAFGSVWDGFDLRAATCIDATHLEQVFDTLRLGLRSPAVSTYLTDLTVELPSTWHVARALEALHEGSNTHSRLEHLRVDITDDTGVSGNLKDLDTSSGFIANENHDGEWEDHGPDGVGHPPSNVQLTWPNRSHQDALWDALTRFKNLRSLAVHATHQLDLPRLTQKLTAAPDGTLTGLSALHLSRVYVTFSSLARLLVPSRIKRVFFDNLIMRHTSSDQHSTRPDTWIDIFDYMRRYCRHLESIDAGDLTYWSTHPLFRPIRVPGVETMLVWSTDDGLADRRAYEQLRRRCRARLKGKNVYPCFDEELDEAGEAALQKGRFEMGQLRKGLDAITN